MTTDFSSAEVRVTLKRLRSPCARSAYLVFPYSLEGTVNRGYTLRLPEAEPVVAAENGVVSVIRSKFPDWAYTQPSAHQTQRSFEVVLDHGNGVHTTVAGLHTLSVAQGATVERGQALGFPLLSEVFFGVQVNGKSIDPASANKALAAQNALYVVDAGNEVRFAPDKILRDLSGGVSVFFLRAAEYFVGRTRSPLLVNVDFNGSGAKVGQAAVGYTASDVWNTVEPTTYTDPYASSCLGTTTTTTSTTTRTTTTTTSTTTTSTTTTSTTTPTTTTTSTTTTSTTTPTTTTTSTTTTSTTTTSTTTTSTTTTSTTTPTTTTTSTTSTSTTSTSTTTTSTTTPTTTTTSTTSTSTTTTSTTSTSTTTTSTTTTLPPPPPGCTNVYFGTSGAPQSCTACCEILDSLGVGECTLISAAAIEACFGSVDGFTVGGRTYSTVQENPDDWQGSAGQEFGTPYNVCRTS